jgi:hypothetical protein
LLLFFREVHDAEKFSFDRRLRFRFRRWLCAPFHRFARRQWRAWFVAARLGALRWLGTLRLIMRRRLRTLRLDAAQRPTKFLKFAFVGDFLPLGDFDEFQNFVHLVVQILQRRGDEHRVFDGLADGGRRGGTEISGLDPLALGRRNAGRRLRRALIAAVIPARFAARRARRFRRSFSNRFRLVRLGGRRVLMRVKTFGRFRMRLAEAAGGFGFVFRVRGFSRFDRGGDFSAGFSGFRRGGNFPGRFFRRRARTAGAAATTAAAAAAIAGGAGR